MAKAKANPKPGTTTAAIAGAIASGDGGAALIAALAAWREARALELADLIDAISARVSGPPIGKAEWQAIASKKDPVALGGLLAGVPELAASFLPTAATMLAAFPDDPRITGAMRAWVIDPPTTSSSTYPFWTKMFELAARTRDTRLAASCAKRLKTPKEKSQFWPKFYGALERTRDKLADESSVAVDAKAIAKLAAAAGKLKPATAPATIAAARKPAGKSTELLLAQARVHVDAGNIAAAIDAMVERWREIRVPALADLIDRASTLLPSYDLPLPTGKAAAPAWDAAFAEGSARLPQVLRGLGSGGPKLTELRLVELANLPDDPRIASRLAEMTALRTGSPERTQLWKSLFELVARIADVRTAEPLRLTFSDFANTYYNHHRQAKRLIAPFVLAETSRPAAWPVYPTTPDLAAATALGAAIDAAVAADPARALVAAIVATPGDPGPRLVYADWLSDRGHPRGEAIVIAEAEDAGTATGAQRERLADLFHSGTLYDTFDDLCEMPGRGPQQDPTVHLADYLAMFPRALPRALELEHTGMLTWQRAIAHPLWPLVDSLTTRDPSVYGSTDDGPISALLGDRFRYSGRRFNRIS